MTDDQPLGAAEANLFVSDFRRARDFYVGSLGFRIVFEYGQPPYYGQFERDEAVLNLRLVCEPVYAGDIRERETLLAASISVAASAKVDQLEARLRSSGVRIVQASRDEPWGARTLIIADPDGNLILFGGPTAPSP